MAEDLGSNQGFEDGSEIRNPLTEGQHNDAWAQYGAEQAGDAATQTATTERSATMPDVSEATADLDAAGNRAGEDLDTVIDGLSPMGAGGAEQVTGSGTVSEERFNAMQEQLTRRLDELQAKIDKMAADIEQAQRGMRSGPSTPVGEETQVLDPSEAPTTVIAPDNNQEIGNHVGNPGAVEFRTQDESGSPHIYRRSADGSWQFSNAGNNPVNWFDASEQQVQRAIARSFGITLPETGVGAISEPAARVEQTQVYPTPPAIEQGAQGAPVVEQGLRTGLTPAGQEENDRNSNNAQETEKTEENDPLLATLAAVWASEQIAKENHGKSQELIAKAIALAKERGQSTKELDAAAAAIAKDAAAEGGPDQPEAGNDDKKEKRKRLKKYAKVAVGALLAFGAGAATMYLLNKHGVGVSGPKGTHGAETITGGGPKGGAGTEALTGSGKYETLTHSGDLIWTHGKEDLTKALGGKAPTNPQIQEWCDRVMNLPENKGRILNSMGHWQNVWDGARHLPVNFKFRVNDAIARAVIRGY